MISIAYFFDNLILLISGELRSSTDITYKGQWVGTYYTINDMCFIISLLLYLNHAIVSDILQFEYKKVKLLSTKYCIANYALGFFTQTLIKILFTQTFTYKLFNFS